MGIFQAWSLSTLQQTLPDPYFFFQYTQISLLIPVIHIPNQIGTEIIGTKKGTSLSSKITGKNIRYTHSLYSVTQLMLAVWIVTYKSLTALWLVNALKNWDKNKKKKVYIFLYFSKTKNPIYSTASWDRACQDNNSLKLVGQIFL